MDVNDEDLARFIEATHCGVEQAQFFLEASGGNYDRALNLFYGELAGRGRSGGRNTVGRGGGSRQRQKSSRRCRSGPPQRPAHLPALCMLPDCMPCQ